MTIETHCDEETFEQIKKQLNRMVEVIKVIDFTDLSVCMKEILYVKIRKCTLEDKTELFQIAQTFRAEVIDYGKDSMLLEFLQTAKKRCCGEAFTRGISGCGSCAWRKRWNRSHQYG